MSLFAVSGSARAVEPTTRLIHALEPSARCAECHAFPNRSERRDEPNYAPYAWEGSLMANAARDPIFWAGVALAQQDDPAHTDACIRCHSPRAFLQGRKDATHPSQLQLEDFDGVGCDVCHRMNGAQDLDNGNAQFVLLDWDNEKKLAPPKLGPWTYQEPLHPQLKHGWSDKSSFLASSESCGTCHNVTTPRPWLNAQGEVIGPGFPEQRTYSEWKGSVYAQEGSPMALSCQDCHMQAVADVAGSRVLEKEGILHARGGRHHQFGGVNIPMLEFLKQHYGEQGSNDVRDHAFDDAIATSRRQLASAAMLTLKAPSQVDLRQGLTQLDVRVENRSGHKLPTGYSEGRVMWLEITASYRGVLVYQSGFWDATTRSFSQDPQVRRYEALAEQASTGQTFHLLKNDRWLLDTRIPPWGLVPNPETDPVTDRYPLVNGAWAHYDDVGYNFGPAPLLADATGQDPTDDTLDVTARLLYWINTDDYVDVVVRDNVINDAGQTLARDWTAFGKSEPVELTRATVSIPITGFGTTPPPPEVLEDFEKNPGCASPGRGDLPWVPAFLGILVLGRRIRRKS